MDEYESLSHTQVGVQIPRGVHSEVPAEDAVRATAAASWERCSASWPQQKESRIEEGHLMPDHVHMMICDPAEVCGVAGGRVHQGQERDPFGAGLRGAEAQLRRAAFLGARILRVHGGARRGGDPRVHPEPGGGGQAPGSTEPVALSGHLQVAQTRGAALATPS